MRPASLERAPWLPWITAPIALAAILLAGCGHPATREECDALFAKSAEIELRGQRITDPKTIADRIADARADRKGVEFGNRCLGKRITKRALTCVEKATTAEEF